MVQLWQTTGRLRFKAFNAELLAPRQIIDLIAPAWMDEPFLGSGLLPVLDDNESNYVALCVRPPVSPRLAWVPHDDSPRLLYRSPERFLTALADAIDAGEWAASFFRDTPGDYPADGPRTDDDRVAGRALLATIPTDDDRRTAVQLLAAGDLAEWAALLETDHFVRRDVLARLRRMSDPKIRELLDRDHRSFEAFAGAVCTAAMAAGLTVGERSGEALQLGGLWISLDGFFYRRHIPDALPRLVAWVEDLIAGRNPLDRPGHFMSD